MRDVCSGWKKDIASVKGAEVTYPIIADTKRDIAELLGMLDADEKDAAGEWWSSSSRW